MQWLDRAACRHPPGAPVSAVGPSRARTEQKQPVCRTCPVLAECLDRAIASAIPFGVLGGLYKDERNTPARDTRCRVSAVAAQAADRRGFCPDARVGETETVRASCEATRRISAREVAVGHTIQINGRQLHVVAVDHDIATAVLTAEFDFLLHFTRADFVYVVAGVHDPSAAG